MGLLHRDPNFDLTQDELSILRGSKVAAEIQGYLARSHDQVGLRISAYRKVAAAARAEREAIIETRLLEMARDNALDISEYRQRVAAAQQQARDALAENDRLRNSLVARAALPAAAVHSSD